MFNWKKLFHLTHFNDVRLAGTWNGVFTLHDRNKIYTASALQIEFNDRRTGHPSQTTFILP